MTHDEAQFIEFEDSISHRRFWHGYALGAVALGLAFHLCQLRADVPDIKVQAFVLPHQSEYSIQWKKDREEDGYLCVVEEQHRFVRIITCVRNEEMNDAR